ncbi:MAG TPA: MOSC N-terminal beta barrel domain-containing protein [Pseudonocardiaceae bacterium]|nr:MOSC N-terminal beta barrel domain-containing protein [Pseudonocardiaceae bacterium]
MARPTVSELVYYPVKGCAGTSVSAARLVATGIVHDRSFMLVDDDGTFRSQRTTPAMAVIRPAVSADGARLTVRAPGTDPAEIDVVADGRRLAVSLFGKWFGTGIDQGDLAAKWFSAVLDQPCRLVRVPPEHDRTGWGEHPGKVGFGDAHAVLLTAESSLDELNRRIAAHGATPVPMNRFRPNIVVSGWPEPHTEDRFRLLSAGGVELGYSTRAIRCAVPTVAQETGVKSGPEPTRTLAGYRREPEFGGGVSFGVKAAVLREGEIAVGDPVLVREWVSG